MQCPLTPPAVVAPLSPVTEGGCICPCLTCRSTRKLWYYESMILRGQLGCVNQFAVIAADFVKSHDSNLRYPQGPIVEGLGPVHYSRGIEACHAQANHAQAWNARHILPVPTVHFPPWLVWNSYNVNKYKKAPVIFPRMCRFNALIQIMPMGQSSQMCLVPLLFGGLLLSDKKLSITTQIILGSIYFHWDLLQDFDIKSPVPVSLLLSSGIDSPFDPDN
jgi:hypothetical protein